MPLKPNFAERLLIKFGVIPGPLLDLGLPSFMGAAFCAAGEIDLFRKMSDGPQSLETLAKKTNADARGLENLLQVLKPLGYVEQKNGDYSLTPYAEKTVPINTFHEMVPFFKEQMITNVKYGARAVKEAPEDGVFGWDNVKSGEIARSYQVSMRWLAGSTVDEVCKKLKLPDGAQRMLDVGGSHGLYCVEMCRKYPELRATVMDWPVGIENACHTLEQEKDVAGRIDTLEGDFHKDDFPKGYDLAFLGNIIHGNSPDENKRIFKKLQASTTDKGTIAIVDQFDNISGSRFVRSVAALIGWNLFLFANGRAYKVKDVQRWLEEAGFTNSKVVPLKQSPGFTLLVASRK